MSLGQVIVGAVGFVLLLPAVIYIVLRAWTQPVPREDNEPGGGW